MMSGSLQISQLGLLTLQLVCWQGVSGGAVQVTTSNYNELRVTNDVLLLNFYADWCRFSQQLKPIFEKAADAMATVDTAGTSVLFGRINCETEKSLCANPFHVSKYPTIKLVRYGEVARKEYRGKRAADALVDYVKNQIKDPVEVLSEYYLITERKDVKKAVVGFFQSNETAEYLNFKKAAVNLRDDCPFFAVLQQSEIKMVYREDEQPDEVFGGEMTDLYSTFSWITAKCIPLVREITFANGEEMTEMGIPLLILFYNPDHPEVKDFFKTRVTEELQEHRGSITAVTADGVLFAHPLHHLGKSKKDLPLIAIDSFRHMYVFPNFEESKIPGKLKQFVDDLHSGKLHREFHHGPDPTQQQQQQIQQQQQDPQQQQKQQRDSRSAPDGSPPESTFRKLRPDHSRYSLLRDEL